MKRVTRYRLCGAAIIATLAVPPGMAQQTDRRAGVAQRHNNHPWKTTPAARSAVRRRDQGERRAIESVVGPAQSCRPSPRPTSC